MPFSVGHNGTLAPIARFRVAAPSAPASPSPPCRRLLHAGAVTPSIARVEHRNLEAVTIHKCLIRRSSCAIYQYTVKNLGKRNIASSQHPPACPARGPAIRRRSPPEHCCAGGPTRSCGERSERQICTIDLPLARHRLQAGLWRSESSPSFKSNRTKRWRIGRAV